VLRRLPSLALGFIAIAAMAPSSGHAQGVPGCPSENETLEATTVGYGREGQGLAVDVLDSDGAALSNVTLTVSARDGSPPRVQQVEMSSAETQVIVPAPSAGEEFTLALDWDQDAGTPRACHGHTATNLPLVPADARVGDPGAARLSGRYRITFRPIDYSGARFSALWRITPLCDFFACSARLRSTLGLRGKVRYIGGQTDYAVEGRYQGYRDCVSADERRVVAENGYRQTYRVTLRVVRTRSGRATTLVGRRKWTYTRTAAARRRGCRNEAPDYDAVRLQAIR